MTGPALELVEQDEEQRRGVGGSVIRRVRSLSGHGEFAESQLVQDLAGLRLAEVVAFYRLEIRQCEERRARELRNERQCLVAGNQAVPPEQRHEPREAGGRECRCREYLRIEAQSSQVGEALEVDAPELVPIRLEGGRLSQPVIQVTSQLRARRVEPARTGGAQSGHVWFGVRPNLEGEPAILTWLERERGPEATRLDLAAAVGGDPCFPPEAAGAVPEHELSVVRQFVDFAPPGLGVL